ncbi:MAG: galactokinase [Lacticaseibacillus paracasei]|mgnify:FL=1|uniref:galactokinase n=1 Tax=Lacticaseibacillus paracasei TaxID=1597 RepID=UPI00345D359B
MNSTDVTNGFTEQFGKQAEHTFFAPGRINLIGEHTDYNGGHVFPCAISLGTYAAVGTNEDNAFRLYSANFPKVGIIDIPFSDLFQDKRGLWTDYFQGMARVMKTAGANFTHGLNVYINGNLPDGAGLSSSASLEMLVGTILNSLFDGGFEPLELVQFGVKVENDYIGVNSGVMDQFAIEMGRANQATLLDTNTMKYEYLPVEMGDNVIVIMNTNKRRELADSKYNERRSECEKALAMLQKGIEVKSLGQLSEDEFDENTYLIYDPILIKRARHAVFENQRTLKASKALQDGDLKTFGKLVSASGVSLAFDYEVTGIELDTLVTNALKQRGVLGARMTGAGFGGCAIAIVNSADVEDFIDNVGKTYREKIGYDAHFYVADIADGAKQLN